LVIRAMIFADVLISLKLGILKILIGNVLVVEVTVDMWFLSRRRIQIGKV